MDIQTLLNNSANHLSWAGWLLVLIVAWGQIAAAKDRASFRRLTSARLERLSEVLDELKSQANEIEDRGWTIAKAADEIRSILATTAGRIKYMDEAIVAAAGCPERVQYLEDSVTAICGTLGQMHARNAGAV